MSEGAETIMQWMIRNDGVAFETVERVHFDPSNGMENLSALAWLYGHTRCIVTGYYILKLFVLSARKENAYIKPQTFYCKYTGNGYFTAQFLSEISNL